MEQSRKYKRKGVIKMNDKIEAMLDKKVKVELKVRELYLLSIIACKGVSLSKRILKTETLDEEILEALNTIIKHEIPRIASQVMDQIGIFKIVDILPKLNEKGMKK